MQVLLFQFALFVAMAGQGTAGHDAEESLRATHDEVKEAVKSSNLEAIARIIHPNAIGFFRQSQGPVSYDARRTLPAILSSLADLVIADSETACKVYERTGVVVERFDAQELVGRNQRAVSRRSTYTYSRFGERWRLVSWHDSGVVRSQQ